MRLRTYESFWLLKNGLMYSYPMLQQDMRSELVVIGGGITGALISHALIEKGYDVILLDRRDIGQGSTAATTSMLQYEIDVQLQDLAKKIGMDGAALCYKEGIRALHDMEALIRSTGIDCGFRMKKSLYLAHNKQAAIKLKKEFELRDSVGLGVEWLSPDTMRNNYGVHGEGGILSSKAASMDAYKLAHELIQYNVKRGLKVFDQTEIERIEVKQNPVRIKTQAGHSVQASRLIFCNGFEAVSMLKEKVARLIYTYACVSEISEAYPSCLDDLLIWDTNDPYLYLRATDDGRVLVGGEDSPFNDSPVQQVIKEKKSVNLQKKLKKLMPGMPFIEDFSWGGVFGTTTDGLPYIGESPEYPHCLFVLGFGGNGITFSVQGMKMIPDLLEGKSNVLTPYYRFGRPAKF